MHHLEVHSENNNTILGSIYYIFRGHCQNGEFEGEIVNRFHMFSRIRL